MKNIFITGATGYIGSRLIDFLLQNSGYKLYLLCRDLTKLKSLGQNKKVEIISGDLHTFNLPDDIYFHAVIHLAACTNSSDIKELDKTNIEGTRNLCKKLSALKNRPRKFIYMSSVSVFAGHLIDGIEKIISDMEYKAADAYGNSKIEAEKIIKNCADFDISIIRSAFVCDENKYLNIIKSRLKNLKFKIVVASPSNYWHTVKSAVLIKMIFDLLEKKEKTQNTILFGVNEKPVKVRDFYNSIADELQVKRPVFLRPLVYDILRKANNFINRIANSRFNIENNVIAIHRHNEQYFKS